MENKNLKFSKINYKKLIIGVLVIGIILRFALSILYHVSGDACWNLSIAKFIGENYRIPLFENLGRDGVFSRGPLFHIIGAVFFNVFGIFGASAANFGLKMVSPLFGSLTLILFYNLVKKFYNEKITFLAVLILTFFPLHMYYSTISYADSTLAFFALLSVFLISRSKYILASIVAGLTVLVKIEGLFMIPLLLVMIIYKNRTNTKAILQRGIAFLAISFAVYIPLLIRNFIFLGNPVWPFLVQFIGGYPVVEKTYISASFMNLFNIFNVITPYLELFGVPNGNYRNLFFFDIPFIGFFIVIWIAATLFFFSFFIYGLIKSNKKLAANVFSIMWIGTFIVFLILTIIFTNLSLGRYLISAIPAIAIIWALGINEALKIKKIKTALLVIITLIISGFVLTEFVKTIGAERSWDVYEKDFDWIRSNTGEDSTIFFVGQCLAYNTERLTVYPIIPLTKQYTLPEKLEELGESYVWVNQEFNLEAQSILPNDIVKIIENDYELVYDNEKTKTKLYKVKR